MILGDPDGGEFLGSQRPWMRADLAPQKQVPVARGHWPIFGVRAGGRAHAKLERNEQTQDPLPVGMAKNAVRQVFAQAQSAKTRVAAIARATSFAPSWLTRGRPFVTGPGAGGPIDPFAAIRVSRPIYVSTGNMSPPSPFQYGAWGDIRRGAPVAVRSMRSPISVTVPGVGLRRILRGE